MKLLLLLVCLVGTIRGNNECIPRDYGNGGIVCVCTEKYCDTVDPVPALAQGEYVDYVSSQAGLRFKMTKGSFSNALITNPYMQVDPSTQYQTILGWGACFTDATWLNVNGFSTAAQELFWKSYFGPDGIDYSLCRVPLGGTDFSNRPYTLDDLPDGQVDPELTNFNLTREDTLFRIPIMKKALGLSTSNLKFIASAWSAPPWMKMNNNVSGFGGFIKPIFYQTWADYHLKFLQAYEAAGITYWGVTTGNEPINGLLPSRVNANAWTPLTTAKWVAENFGPSIRRTKYNYLKILGLDDQRFFLPWWMDILFATRAGPYIDGTSVHWYWNFLTPASVLSWLHYKHPEKLILAAEASILFAEPRGVLLGAWYRGEQYAEDILDNLMNWGQGWLDWNFAVDLGGGPCYTDIIVDGSIVVNVTAGEFYKQPMYYALGHFSKFIPPGSVRVGLTGNSDLYSAALKRPDGSFVVVIFNKTDQDKTVKIVDNIRGVIDKYVPKRSISTVVYY